MTIVQPTILDEVIFEALSEDAYAVSLAHKSSLEGWLLRQHNILHQGSTYSVHFHGDAFTDGHHNHAGEYRFRVIMSSPSVQGHAEVGRTRVYITSHSHISGHHAGSNGHPDPMVDLQESDRESIEIAEDFLANSTLPSMLSTSSVTEQPGRTDIWDIDGHKDRELHPKTQIPLAEWTCTAQDLHRQVSAERDDSTIYVRTSDLQRIGVLNGDWVGGLSAVLLLR